MMSDSERSSKTPNEAAPKTAATGTVLPFRPRPNMAAGPAKVGRHGDSPAPEPDDFRHRMLMNAAGLALAIALTASGIWLASSLSNLRRTQDCVLSGRRDCAPISAVSSDPPTAGQH